YTITQKDLDDGSVTNTAFATDGTTKSDPDSETVTADQMPALTLVKAASPNLYYKVGDIITYTYTLTNSGNVTLDGPFTITDNKATAAVTQPADGKLSPGESCTGTATHIITQDDLNALFVKNTAQGHGFFGTTPIGSNEAYATVYRNTGALLPTQTTVQDYVNGTYTMYDAFYYNVDKKLKTISSVNPGVIFYYNTILAPSESFTMSVVQTNDLSWKPMEVQQVQAYIYDKYFNRLNFVATQTIDSTGKILTVTFNVSGLSTGEPYYIGIKYAPTITGTLVGAKPPTNIYKFSTFIGGTYQIGSEAKIEVRFKK
ncbi:MAG: hypothetical protein GT601_17420, partial [Acidaminobacter sp.]|uniref:DUF7507 domain-containing protein n=1 Tax=Acidaminobacter sp. TaxID=1872102 RepID=UPI00138410C3|nr:hypothetical protein [Acidaminobacter sp.]